MSEEYIKIGDFVVTSGKTRALKKRIIIQDSRGVCVVSEETWKQIQAIQGRNVHIKSCDVA